MAVTPEQFVGLLNERGAAKPCPQCGGHDHTLSGEAGGQKPSLIVFDRGPSADITNARPYDVVVFQCDNCGFVRMFSRAVVERAINP